MRIQSMNAPDLITARETEQLSRNLLGYYEAIESASQDMLQAARTGDWDTGGQARRRLRRADRPAQSTPRKAVPSAATSARSKAASCSASVFNDAEIRTLTEPWLHDLSRMMGASIDPKKMH